MSQPRRGLRDPPGEAPSREDPGAEWDEAEPNSAEAWQVQPVQPVGLRGRVPELATLIDPTGPVPEGGLVFRPSLRAAAGPILSAVAAVLAFGLPTLFFGQAAAGDARADPGFVLALLLGVFGAALGVLLPLLFAVAAAFLKVGFTRYVLDQDGIHVRTRLLSTQEQRVPWEKVTAVRQARSIFDSLLGVERLDVIAYGERGATLHLVGLRDAAPLRDLVAQRMRHSASLESLLRRD